MNVHRPSLNASNRADVDNPAAAILLQHLPGSLLSAEEVSLQVCRMNEVPIRLGHQQRIDLGEARRIVHQRINRPHFSEEPFDLAHLCKVRAEDRRTAAKRTYFFRLRSRVPVVDQYPRPFAVQACNNSPANPPRRPSHQYSLSS